jgi:hypothetical protein
VGDRGGELASLRETGTEETRDLLDQGVRGDEGVVLAGELLDQLLVLVELLEIVGGHGVDTVVLSSVDVVLVTEDAAQRSVSEWKERFQVGGVPNTHARAGDDRELDGSGETLVALRIVVLEADLKFDRLEEVSLLLLEGVIEKLLHIGAHSG